MCVLGYAGGCPYSLLFEALFLPLLPVSISLPLFSCFLFCLATRCPIYLFLI